MTASFYADWGRVNPVMLVLDNGAGAPMRLRIGPNGELVTLPSRADIVNVGSGAASPSTLTPLTAWLDTDEYEYAIFSVQNLDSSNPVFMFLETSEDATHADVNATTIEIPAQQQGSVSMSDFIPRYWRLSAYTTGPGFPTVAVTWAIRAISR